MKKPAPFGKYYLLERINVGGMAEVFRAKAFGVEGFERLVAVKRILPNIAEDKEFIRMFIEEAKLAVQLNHANIAQIFDLGVVDGSYYIALEHVHGRDLRGIFDRCRNHGEAMPVAQACFVVMKVCEGLDYAHNKRDQSGRELSLVHRDVSPQNVLVSFEGEVKLIDFGIAKAAGKGSKTQAGILKGKFGYMSPEQVRGLPIDRRSDVFSCGIVLYELLTGERLFVGESDFSTLEKVRNVEILPPSTYNRKIPDELERIVLKALAKDSEDRYQNAIDLHDELQAFVYTAGEFYSRKDLAGWMKKTFGKEIEDETAKLESYRQLKPPAAEAPPPAVPRTITGGQGGSSKHSAPTVTGIPPVTVQPASRRSSTQGLQGPQAQGTKPPPPPRLSGAVQVVVEAKDDAPKSELAWDEDELETHIYDNPEAEPKGRKAPATGKNLPLVAAPTPGPEIDPRTTTRGIPPAPSGNADIPSLASANSASASPTVTGAAPDLSSLVPPTRGWDAGNPNPGLNPGLATNGASPNGVLAHGSNKAPVPLPPDTRQPLFDRTADRIDRSAPFDPMATYGANLAKRGGDKRTLVLVAASIAVLAVIGIVVVIAMSGGDKTTTTPATAETPAPSTATTGSAPAPTAAVGDQNTGFDLYVSPAGVTQWKLDGDVRTERLPRKIRGLAPGKHTIAIEPPPGFMSHDQQVVVELGKAQKLEIVLSPVEGIHGYFESTPPDATVSLIVDGKRQILGASPQRVALDPRRTYQVLFEKPGYVSVNRPIVLSGQLEEKVVVPMEKSGGVALAPVDPPKVDPPKVDPPKEVRVETPKEPKETRRDPKREPKTGPVTRIEKEPKEPKEPKVPDPKPEPKEPAEVKPAGFGTLMVSSKPSCDIFVDGSNTGLHTPQRAMKLSAGKHRITLMNNEFGIKETFVVEIKPDSIEKAIKDYSDRLPQ